MSHSLRLGGFHILGDDRPRHGKLKAWFKSFQTRLCQVKSVSLQLSCQRVHAKSNCKHARIRPEVAELFPTLHLP
jgi:hypothetical protein